MLPPPDATIAEAPALAEQMACTCCDATRLRPVFAKDGYDYVRCRSCGVVLLRGRSYEKQAQELYDHLYEHFDGFDPLTERRYDERMAELARYRRTNRLLDVGCGAGHLLQVAHKHGWEVEGTDTSAVACALGRQRGVAMHEGDLVNLQLPSERFDVIVMLELMEHMEHPADVLREAHRLLRSGGALLLSTPNYDGLTRRLIGAEWRVFDPEHRHYFTRRSLARLLCRCGFAPGRIECVNWNPYDALASRRFAVLRGQRGPGSSSAGDPRAAEQGLRRRIYSNRSLRAAKDMCNGLLLLAGAGDTIWAYAHKS